MTKDAPRNVLFIMCDQLRYDYLGCYGHPTLDTPHIDALAAKGVQFTNAYVQSPICGPSRMSTYTGRYVRSHGSTWNSYPLRVGEMTLGDHLNPLGVRTALCGKTHMRADLEGMKRLGIDPTSAQGQRMAECGFEVWDRLDGLHPRASPKKPSHYQDYLRSKGYAGDNPWEDYVNAPAGNNGEPLSPWEMQYADRPARVAEEHSETAYSTDRAIEFIDDAGDQPWCLHLSYIKPHWPYVAPAPYHNMYSEADVLPVVRSDVERDEGHPLLQAYQQGRVSQVFTKPGLREHVIPTYMGLIKQIDDHVGRLVAHLKDRGLDQNTLIVFTSDHGDYLGDHWMGEKDFFHDCSVKIPLIVVDPSQQADATRGSGCDALVEAIDLVPTFIDYVGGDVPSNVVEGKSLCGLLHGRADKLRDYVISEYDFSARQARAKLGKSISDCRTQMVFDGRYKLVNIPGERPVLFDLERDPQELNDLGADPALADEVLRLRDMLLDWALQHHARVTMSDRTIENDMGSDVRAGIFIGCWDEDDIQHGATHGRLGY